MIEPRRLSRLTRVTLLVAAVWLLSACSSRGENGVITPRTLEGWSPFIEWIEGETDEAPGAFVLIRIDADPSWVVLPPNVVVCKKPKVNCENKFTFWWLPPDPGGATLRIEPKPDQPDCFDPVELQNPPSSVTVEVKPGCPAPTEWWYTVSCQKAGGEECLPPLDPLVIIRH